MSSADDHPLLNAWRKALQQRNLGDAMRDFDIIESQYGLYSTKWIPGYQLLRDDPNKWFRGNPIDDRDLALIKASPVPWIDIGMESYLMSIGHEIRDKPREVTHWTFANDNALRGMISEVGAGFTGFAEPPAHLPARDWQVMQVNVKITGNIAPGVTLGQLSGRPSTARVLAGPSSCEKWFEDPSDIMILRDFYTNSSGLDQVAPIASRLYDILLMKMCDVKYPWVVLAVNDSTPYEVTSCSSNTHCRDCDQGF